LNYAAGTAGGTSCGKQWKWVKSQAVQIMNLKISAKLTA
jgi:hypothetical protein